MRQVGTLSTQSDASRFAAWLVAQRMEAHAEQVEGGWAIWVRDEDHLQQAREALTHFREQPQDARYQGAEQTAEAVLREEESKRKSAHKNVVEMRGRWGGGPGGISRRCPLVLVMIAASVLVALATNGGNSDEGGILRTLAFVDPTEVAGTGGSGETGQLSQWTSILKGEVWRLVTPIFIHFGWTHLILNMFWLYSFGGEIEDRRGSRFVAALVLLLAITSNCGQALEISLRESIGLFGGMSGVGYGLFGYMLVKAKFDSRERYILSPGTTFLALLWLVLCIARQIPPTSELLQDAIPPIANSAHVVGLAVGAGLAYLPLLVRKPA